LRRLLVLLFLSSSLVAQEKPVTISGVVFGDYYYAVSHHDEEIEGMNGFWIRRGYLTLDRSFSDQLSAQFRLEVAQPGDFRTNANLEPFVKDAWLRWKHSPALEVIAGLSPSPAIVTVERVWGYRSVEKTALDLQRMIATRDLGVAVQGAAGRIRYHAQVGNGASTGSETNAGKKFAASVSLLPTASTLFDVYADHDDRPGDTGRTTLQLLGALTNERMRVGVQLGRQFRDNADDLDVASLFAVYNLGAKYALLARVDRNFDPNPEGDRILYLPFDPTRESFFFLTGVDWKLHKNVSVIPNVEYIAYDDGGDDDLFGRVTLNFTF
jgi:hypothetical protein